MQPIAGEAGNKWATDFWMVQIEGKHVAIFAENIGSNLYGFE